MKVDILLFPILVSRLVRAVSDVFKSEPYVACSSHEHCPEEWPCCSQYGQCGYGPLCMGGCDPRFSHSYESCAAIPAMYPQAIPSYIALGGALVEPHEDSLNFLPTIDAVFDLPEYAVLEDKLDKLEDKLSERGFLHYSRSSDMDVDSNLFDFLYSGFVKVNSSHEDSALVLGMPPDTTGSLVSSSKSFLYGKVSVEMKVARGKGVVSAMVLMSAVKDEVDFEFLGGELDSAQSNFYHRGELIHTRMQKSRIWPDGHDQYHRYEFDWNEDRINWLIDGSVVRTLHRMDTYDPVTGVYKYPSTPMRLEIAVWPGGVESNHPGTVMWAGGLIDWTNAIDIVQNGQFELLVKNIQVTPYVNALLPLELDSVGSMGSSSDDFYYVYDPACDTYVRGERSQGDQNRKERTTTNEGTLHEGYHTTMAGSVVSTQKNTLTTTNSNVTRLENVAPPFQRLNLIFRLRGWLGQ
ncbi:putative glycosylase LALA0_S05e08218g [Lachancea lanzarotensis]|uniref:LALA0S05e08218g1_1 n=1 Tax=Lachancea lanzarotensis TaxID=1245769 RepID=A0A0C7MY06_9SACH|nr:uncharacterized protein LALA0_S05e08218g [Lachancea lanzarotensis]CEP62554.1 LALA0S05e08218g1_1 [Lachancea lanzarotensis]